MIRRYEVSEGNVTKFWEIETKDDVSFICRWGKVGAMGRNERNYGFPDAAAAIKNADKLIAEKLKTGFALVGKPGKAAKPPKVDQTATTRAAKKKATTEKATTNEKLESILADNPEDAGTWQVYADWLIELGEPWGEVIAAASTGKRPKKQQDEATKDLLRGLDNSSLEWRFGTIDKVSLCPEEEDEGDDDDDDENDEAEESTDDGLRNYGRALKRILAHPAGRLVRELELGLPPGDDIDWGYHSIIPALTGAGTLPLLRVLDMTPDAEFMDQDSWRSVGDLRKLWKVAPRLREVRLKGSGGDDGDGATRLGDIVAPHLERFIHISSGIHKSVLVDLGKATLLELRHLELYIGQEDYGWNGSLKHLAGILEGKGLPRLEYLGIVNSEMEVDLIRALAKAPIVRRLKTLDLSKGVLFRDGAAALLEHAAAFRHLALLDLSDNYLEDAQAAAIKKAIPCANVDDQKEVEDWDGDHAYRYVTVGE
jgi:uncharacterized protein (TIGR02996 family)